MRIANVYYTAESAITEYTSWTTNLSNTFASTSATNGFGGILRIRYDPFSTALKTEFMAAWYMNLDGNAYPWGDTIRHELGHGVQHALHGLGHFSLTCNSYIFNWGANNHATVSCEYGMAATLEGFADFIAVRSITTADTNAWSCSCADPSNRDVCSAQVAGAVNADADRIDKCVGGSAIGIGDDFASLKTHCARLRPEANATGCACPNIDGTPAECDGTWYQANGWRNEIDVARYLWDLIDTNNEGGQDDTDESMSSLAALFEAMPCSASGYGIDGNCNEPNRASASACSPTDGAYPPSPAAGTRDAYNAWDIGDFVPGSQTTERTLNCVQGATD